MTVSLTVVVPSCKVVKSESVAVTGLPTVELGKRFSNNKIGLVGQLVKTGASLASTISTVTVACTFKPSGSVASIVRVNVADVPSPPASRGHISSILIPSAIDVDTDNLPFCGSPTSVLTEKTKSVVPPLLLSHELPDAKILKVKASEES